MQTILIVDDDKSIRYSLKRMLEENFSILTAQNGEEGLMRMKESSPDLILMDIKMPGRSGIEVLKEMKSIDPKSLVILMTAYGTTDTAIEAMKFGAFDYILKPFPIPQMKELVQKAIALRKLMKEEVSYAPEPDQQKEEEQIVGSSLKMQEIYKVIGQIAPSDVTVLIRGESGTGKELMARAIYHYSLRSNHPFLPVNCAAIPDTLLESELFGHEKGAFTGAIRRKKGRFELAQGGTLFLDEIGDISPAMQVRLLRVLQERQVEPLGGLEPVSVDVRVIAATHQDLAGLIQAGRFREDLYYRLHVIHLKLPPLKERREDIPLLVDHLVDKFNRLQGKQIAGLSQEALARLLEYDYPGNVRELENIIEQAFVLCRGGLIDVAHLPPEMRATDEGPGKTLGPMSLEAMERRLILETLWRCSGNRKQAARELGIDVSSLYRKIRALQLEVPETDGRSRKK
jgi:two-component system nitrogen regulation response regulator GlnG